MRAKVISFLVIIFLVALFAVQNPNPVTIKFFTYQMGGISLIVVVLAALIVGVILGVILSMVGETKLSKKIHEQADEIRYLKKELAKKPEKTTETK